MSETVVPTGKNPKAKQCDGLVAKLDGVFFCFDYVLNMCVCPCIEAHLLHMGPEDQTV